MQENMPKTVTCEKASSHFENKEQNLVLKTDTNLIQGKEGRRMGNGSESQQNKENKKKKQ